MSSLSRSSRLTGGTPVKLWKSGNLCDFRRSGSSGSGRGQDSLARHSKAAVSVYETSAVALVEIIVEVPETAAREFVDRSIADALRLSFLPVNNNQGLTRLAEHMESARLRSNLGPWASGGGTRHNLRSHLQRRGVGIRSLYENIDALKAAGALDERPGLVKVLNQLQPDNTLVVSLPEHVSLELRQHSEEHGRGR